MKTIINLCDMKFKYYSSISLTKGLLFFIVLFLTSNNLYSQTYSELYDLDFKRTNSVEQCWIKESVYAVSEIDSTQSVNGKHPMRICYPKLTFDSGKSTNIGMYMNFYQMLILPEKCNDHSVIKVSINSKSEYLNNIFFKVWGIDENENIVCRDSIALNSEQWMEQSITFKGNQMRCLYLEIMYHGSQDRKQCLWLDRVTVAVDNEDIRSWKVDEALPAVASIKSNYIVRLDSANDSTMLKNVVDVRNKKVVAIAESCSGSQSVKDMNYVLLKNLIQSNRCKVVMLEGLSADMALTANLYVQNLIQESYEEELEEMLKPTFDDYKSRVSFIKWLRGYNKKTHGKVHLLGLDQVSGNSFYLHSFFQYALDSIQGHDYLVKVGMEKYRDMCDLASKDSNLRLKLGDEFYKYLHWVLEEAAVPAVSDSIYRRGFNDDDIMKGYRMFCKVNHAITCFLKDEEMIAISAHSRHLASGNIRNEIALSELHLYKEKPLGYYLRDAFGKDFFSIGVQIGRGEYTAFAESVTNPRVVKELTENPKNSLEAYLSKAKEDVFYYLSKEIPHEVYTLLQITETEMFRQFCSPRIAFDAYIFIRDSEGLKNILKSPFYVSELLNRLKFEQATFYSKNHVKVPAELKGIPQGLEN